MASKEAPRGAALREALIEGAWALIEAEGYAAFNLRALTQQLGVTQPAIYRHFESREALLGAVMHRGFLEGESSMAPQLDPADPYGLLGAYGRGYVRFGVRYPGWFRLCFGRRGALDSLAHAEVPRSQGLALAALARIVPPDDPAYGPSWRMLWGLAHGLTFLTVERVFSLVQDDAARVDAADAALENALANLRARWGEPGPPTTLRPDELFARLRPPSKG